MVETIYNYHPESGIYLSASLADESPLEPGVSLIPANATTDAPPGPGPGQKAIFQAGAWAVVDIPPPPQPPAPTAAEVAAARKSEITGQLSALDAKSIRPLREGDAVRVAALDAQSAALRAELAKL